MGQASNWHLYALGIGSNRRHAGKGPKAIVNAAFGALDRKGLRLIAASPIIASAPIGPSRRAYANAAAIVSTKRDPGEMLSRIHKIEKQFGRRRARRWGERTLDIDILLWSGGICAEKNLSIPHPALAGRDFVLGPLCRIAPQWRDPLSGRTVRHLRALLNKPRAKAG